MYVAPYQQHPSLLLHALNIWRCQNVLVQQPDVTESKKEEKNNSQFNRFLLVNIDPSNWADRVWYVVLLYSNCLPMMLYVIYVYPTLWYWYNRKQDCLVKLRLAYWMKHLIADYLHWPTIVNHEMIHVSVMNFDYWKFERETWPSFFSGRIGSNFRLFVV